MIRPQRVGSASPPSLPLVLEGTAAPVEMRPQVVWRHSAPSAPTQPAPAAAASARLLPPRPAAHRVESRQSVRLRWSPLPRGRRVDAATAPERRLQYIVQSRHTRSIWPLVNLLCASVGRSFVSLAGGLLADNTRHAPLPAGGMGPDAQGLNDTVQAAAMGCGVSADVFLAVRAAPKPPGATPTAETQTSDAPDFVSSGVLLGFGVALFCFGAGRFAWDTSKIDGKRAALMASLSFSGFALVVVGNAVAEYGLDSHQPVLEQSMLLPRALGTYLIFLSIPKSFSTCELVRGDARLPHREFIRQQLGAWGPVVFALWGTFLANPNLDSSAHEVMLGAALMMLVIANALSETNVARARAAARLEPQSVDEQEANEAVVAAMQMPERQI